MSATLTGREAHPVLEMLPETLETLLVDSAPEKIAEFYDVRRQAMAMERADPLRYGFEPPKWKQADAAIANLRGRYPVGVLLELDLGGNRASKTERRAKRAVENLVQHDGWRSWAVTSTETASRETQQKMIYKYLPPEWRPDTGKLRKGLTTKIVYTQAGGFTENVLVCPNGSECRFKFFQGMKVGSLEGTELDEAWGDELVPLDWIDAMIFRLVTRNGTYHGTFTPIEGYTSAVKAFLNGAVTLQEVEAPLLPKKDKTGKQTGFEKVPVVQENLNVVIEGQKSKAVIVYFHTSDNPYGNYESMKATLDGASREKILTRAYGVPTKAALSRFPLWDDLVHIVSLNRFREIQKGDGTWYFFLDPCSGRNWFGLWVFIDVLNRMFVRAEMPSFGHGEAYIPGVGDPGPWAVPSNKLDGSAGDGQREWGWGYARYLEEFERVERVLSPNSQDKSDKQIIHVYERWIDARYGNARRTQEEASTTLIEDLEDAGMRFLAAPSEKVIDGPRHDGSLRKINDALYYDKTRARKEGGISHTNQPKLYVCESCPNTIYALKEWTGQDGQHGASKDPIDCLRMLVLSDVKFVDDALLKPHVPWLTRRR